MNSPLTAASDRLNVQSFAVPLAVPAQAASFAKGLAAPADILGRVAQMGTRS